MKAWMIRKGEEVPLLLTCNCIWHKPSPPRFNLFRSFEEAVEWAKKHISLHEPERFVIEVEFPEMRR